MLAYHALCDVGTHSLLTINRYTAVVVFLTEAIPNCYANFGVNYPTYANEFFLESLDPAEYPQWVWDRDAGRTFVAAPTDIQTDEIRARSRLAVAKATVIHKIMESIGYMRAGVSTGTLYQESVYMSKRLEAQRIKDQGYAVDALHQFPYVVQYADYMKVPLKQAVDDILFQSSLDDQLLAKTETLRIRYFNRVKEATEPEQVHLIVGDYLRDSYFNGAV